VVTAPTKEIADELAYKLKDSLYYWRNIVKNYEGQIAADSSRFENGQLPVKAEMQLKQGFQSMPEKNDAGEGFTFMQIFKFFLNLRSAALMMHAAW